MAELDRQAIEEKFQPRLFGGEYIEWCGEGKDVSSGTPPLLFAIIWTGFALFWTFIVYVCGGGAFSLIGLPFVAIGVMLFVQIFRGGSKEYYALTNMRIFIQIGKNIRAEYYDHITDVRVYPGVKKGVTVVRVMADMGAAFSGKDGVFCDISMENTVDAEYLCRQILSEKEKYMAQKNEQR
ncbi:MAG: hypothetical protein J6C96_03005 [Oscillospiraceae bacterium]|nr:hypothetical protein [Oscillospiraceae bacterium]